MTVASTHPVTIAAAEASELAPALRLVFQYLEAPLHQGRVANALELIRRGEFAAEGVRVARRGEALVGAMIGLPVPGAAALIWPPQAANPDEQIALEDALLDATIAWLRQGGTRLAQALLSARETDLAASLVRHGFQHITRLWYLRHQLRYSTGIRLGHDQLTYRTYARDTAAPFHETLLRTYEGTLDCPELNGVRSVDEIIAGHRNQGLFDPDRWWLALEDETPIGVLLLAEMPDQDSWDLAYLGVVPEARGRGLGRRLACKAIAEARQADTAELTLSVDARNRPAWDLYQSLGFEPFDQREVY